MRGAWRAADRDAEVRAAARGWHAAGRLDEATLGAIVAAHPEAGPRLGPTWRVLVFLCVFIGVAAATGIGLVSFGVREASGVGMLLLACGAMLAVSTDLVIERCRFQSTGAEAATSVLAAGYLCAGGYLLLEAARGPGGAQALCLICVTYLWCAAVFALAAWRWGVRLAAGAAAVCVLLLSAQAPVPRLAWIVVAALLAAGASAVNARYRLTPSHRDGVTLCRIVALAAIFIAVNYLSVDRSWLEELGRSVGGPHHRAGRAELLLAAFGSVAYPLGLLAWGVRSRDRALLGLGVLAAALSLATIRFYVHVAPLWVVLGSSGAALAGASLALERWLQSGRDGERFGFTAAPLSGTERRERLLPIAAALAQAPAARDLHEVPPGASGNGGRFGGGGATGAF